MYSVALLRTYSGISTIEHAINGMVSWESAGTIGGIVVWTQGGGASPQLEGRAPESRCRRTIRSAQPCRLNWHRSSRKDDFHSIINKDPLGWKKSWPGSGLQPQKQTISAHRDEGKYRARSA